MKVATVFACAVLLVLVCSAGASADTACKVNEAPCSKANAWAQETVFEGEIKSGTEISFVTPTHEWKCTGSSRSDRMFLNVVGGGEAQGIGMVPLSETFSGCSNSSFGSCTAAASGFPETFKWHANSASPGDGYASLGFNTTADLITFSCGGLITCKFEFSEDLAHTLEGGSPAIEAFEARYVRFESSTLCGSNPSTLKGEREIVSPSSNPLYVTLG
jgi:hypothetical protein